MRKKMGNKNNEKQKQQMGPQKEEKSDMEKVIYLFIMLPRASPFFILFSKKSLHGSFTLLIQSLYTD